MEEQFYFSRKFVRQSLINLMVRAAIAIATSTVLIVAKILSDIPTEKSASFTHLVVFIFIVGGILVGGILVGSLRLRNKTAVTITDGKMILEPSSFGNLFLNICRFELVFERIISASIKESQSRSITFSWGKIIELRFRERDNKERILHLYLDRIENHEKLLDILKQRIKFV